MKTIRILKAAAIILLPSAAFSQHQTLLLDEPAVGGTLPYQVELREITLGAAELPNIHSVAAAEWDGQWVFLGGRTNGLHGMTGMGAFDPAYENREIWVVDPLAKLSWHKSLESSAASGLGQDVVDSLSAVNAEFYQDEANWLVVGGYGYKRSVADHVTYDRLTVIDLPGIVAWVKAAPGSEATLASDHIQQVADPFFQVTGGGLECIGSEYQLIFGQDYEGRYRPNFNGVYTKQVRRFEIDLSAGLAVPASSMVATPAQDAYRRRDLNITAMLGQGASPGEYVESAVALSGVFTTDNGVWTVPVEIAAGGQVTMADPAAADTLKQAFQIYHCSKAGLYHRATGEMHVLLFGGITVLEYDSVNALWTRDDLAPFTNQCGVVVRDGSGKFRQYFLPLHFPSILMDGKELRFGANAEFFYHPEVARLHPKVIDLAAVRGPTVIGHVFGGLIADAGNGGNTGSSGHVFEVLLTPESPSPAATIVRDGDETTLSWEAADFTSYLIEDSTDLSLWEASSLPLAGDGPSLEWTETRDDLAHFYRVIGGTISHGP